MENCNQNHKRDFAIFLSILFHVLLFAFLFYKIKEQFDESELNQKSNDNPIFLSQELASNLQESGPKEPDPIPEIQPTDLSTQLTQNVQKTEDMQPDKTEPEEEDNTLQDATEKEQEDTQQDIEQQALAQQEILEALLEKIKEEDLKKIKETQIEEKKEITKPVRKRIRRKILASQEDMPTIPNVIDYMKEDLKTNLFKMISDNAQSDMRYLSYQQKILSFFEKAFAALYVGKTLGIPKHEFDQLAMGIVIEIAIDINKDGTVKWFNVRSKLTKLNECIEHALQYAAPYPNIPKHFKLDVFSLKTKFPMGLQSSGKGLMQVYPT